MFWILNTTLVNRLGRKVAARIDVARQMRRARGQDGKRLFAVDDFLTA